ncbi:phosphate ABC transporter permease subunit PstC [Pseudooceanicola sp. CBS1P-1]|uniref:Phosphate transport system permease protein n=1 Tax=Pseudooceanicola albus TaxID=2692189 RepID=A0A6L7G665_9RHOB|nr:MULTISPECIES: phosphate ABC transporter permease subunit PstC [Pseudooceanicola]MBT9382974.1 phosphate ABC transporter permease subunit PstC [Pseudooceanicola endophyticus]MXN19162.1 phosphate ABC transporter permease subunit PstC [Pseudooceanicola albus]
MTAIDIPPPLSDPRARALRADRIAHGVSLGAALVVLLVLIGVTLSLAAGAWPAFRDLGPGFLTAKVWNPVTDRYGAFTAIYGTVITSVLAMLIAVPMGLGIALFLTELCPRPLRRPIGIAIELLAGIPSIIYGIWGLFVLAPLMQHTVQPLLIATLGNIPGIGALFAGPPYGIGLLTAALILAMMVLPFVASLTRDIFLTTPPMLREAAYGMGMTTWEVTRHITLPKSATALVGGMMLALGRALGETMAVTFVIGNAHRMPASLLQPGTTISAAIANEFNEASAGAYSSALIALGFVLFVLTFLVLAAAQLMLRRLARRNGR